MSPSLWTRTVAIGIVVAASVVGNVSVSAPEFSGARPAAIAPAASPTAPAVDKIALHQVGVGTPEASASADQAKADEVEVIPAVFARDPDVRFLFYRQVSKWM